jgi:hypothetical protein
MKSDDTPNTNGRDYRREKLREISKEFRARHGYKPFTAMPNETLESEMMDSSLPKEARTLTGIRRFSWGNLSDWAVDAPPKVIQGDKDPQPITQEQLAKILGISKSSTNEACLFLKEQGYLKIDHPYLFPEEKLMSLESTKHNRVDPNSPDSHSPFLRFRETYLSEHPETLSTISQLDIQRNKFYEEARNLSKEIRKIDRIVLGAWRDYQRKTETGNHDVNPDSNPVNPDSNPEPIRTPSTTGKDSRTRKRASANSPNAAAASAIKPSYINGNGKETTTTIESPSPSTFHDPSAEFRERLALTFSRAGKPLPLKAQAEATYKAVGPHWEEFLVWMPTAREFKRTEHPGGLPTLIEMFKTNLETKKKQTKETQPAEPAEDPAAIQADIARLQAEMERMERETPKGRARA